MTTSDKHHQRIAHMTFSSVFPHYVEKVKKKGRTMDELYEIIQWLTGYSKEEIDRSIEENLTFEQFFTSANLNKNATLIKGSICGYDIEKISNSLTKCVRMLDKLVDELAKGKKLENILR